MKVLLLYPNRTRELFAVPPVGLAYVAHAARKAGHNVKVVDLMWTKHPQKRLIDELAAFEPAVVGMSLRNIDNEIGQRLQNYLPEVSALVTTIRQHTKAPIVVGGPAVSILGERILSHLAVDYAIVGEGEESFVALLEQLAAANPTPSLPGVVHRTEGGVVAPDPARLTRFGSSHLEDWINWKEYRKTGTTWPIQIKRGCPVGCCYCAYSQVEGNWPRNRSGKEVVDEIVRVQEKLGVSTFEFVDSAFNVPPEPAIEVCEEIIRRQLRVTLTAASLHPGHVTERLLTLMRCAGFNSFMVGAESANDQVLSSLHKGFTTKELEHCAQLSKNCGLASGWYFMLGGPGETKETTNETLSFIENDLNWSGCLVIITTGIRILPGTELEIFSRQQGILTTDDDLVEPRFYYSPATDDRWLVDQVRTLIVRRQNVLHAGENPDSPAWRGVQRMLRLAGVAPPYWRFIPRMLSLPIIRQLRARFMVIGS